MHFACVKLGYLSDLMILISEFLIYVYDSSQVQLNAGASVLHGFTHQRSKIQGNIILFEYTYICSCFYVYVWSFEYIMLYPFIGLLRIHEKEWPEPCKWKQLTLISCICGMLDKLRRFWSIPFHAYSENWNETCSLNMVSLKNILPIILLLT